MRWVLRIHGYPPERAVETATKQAKLLSEEWVTS